MTTYRSIGYELARVHKAIRTQFQGLLTPYGITVQQFEVMRALKEDAGITAAQIVERITSDSSTMMAILKRLESKALINRRPDTSDRRTKRIFLTREGQGLMEELLVIADGHNRRMDACCSGKELAVFQVVLGKLHEFSKTEITADA